MDENVCLQTQTVLIINDKGHLPVLARLLPKLKTVPVVVAVPKHPTLKLTAAGLAFKPNPPKLNPPAVVFPAPSPPNPAASRGRQRERENDMELMTKGQALYRLINCKNNESSNTIKRDGTKKRYKATCFVHNVCILPVLVEPKLNPVAGAAALVVATPKPGAVRAMKKKQTKK